MRQHTQRGQALVETFIALPLSLLALFMLFWTAKFAILSERLESDTRYAQQILDSNNLYTEYSIASLYDAATGTPKFLIACQTPPPELISSTTPVTINSIPFPRNGLWSGTNVSPSCSIDHQGLLSNGKFSRDFLIGFQRTAIATQFSPSFGAKMLFPNGPGTLPLRSQSMSTFVAASIADLTLCFPSAFNAVAASLGRGDQTGNTEFSVNAATIHEIPSTINLALDTHCVGTPPKNAGPAIAESDTNQDNPLGNPTPQPGRDGNEQNGSNNSSGSNGSNSHQPTPQPGNQNGSDSGTGSTGSNSGTTTGTGTGSSTTGSGNSNGTPLPGTVNHGPPGGQAPGGAYQGPGHAPAPHTTTNPTIPIPHSTLPSIFVPPGGSQSQPNRNPVPIHTATVILPPAPRPTTKVTQPTATHNPGVVATHAPVRPATPAPPANSGHVTTPAPPTHVVPAPVRTPTPTSKPVSAPQPNTSPPGSTYG